jgi:hypothetical protein
MPDERSKFDRIKKTNRHQTEIGFQNEIARGGDVQDYRIRLRSDRYFYRTARRPAAADRFTVVLLGRSIAAGVMRAISHACHQIRPASPG